MCTNRLYDDEILQLFKKIVIYRLHHWKEKYSEKFCQQRRIELALLTNFACKNRSQKMLWKLLIWKTKDRFYWEKKNNQHSHISISRTRVRLFKIWLKHWWMKLNNFYSHSSRRRQSSWETHDKMRVSLISTIRLSSISTIRFSSISTIRLNLISMIRLNSISTIKLSSILTIRLSSFSTIRLSSISTIRLSSISTIRLNLISTIRLSLISTDKSKLETNSNDKIQMTKMIAILENQTIYENEI